MFQLKKEQVLLLFDNFIYLILLVIGIYFISEGEVFQRFLVGRTDFYHYNEAITEFPTIVTYITDAPTNLSMGKDFNVSLSLTDMLADPTVLTIGHNHIQGTDIAIDFQLIYPGYELMSKITHLNLSTEGAWWGAYTATQKIFKVVFSFANASLWSKPKVSMKLSTENNTLWCSGHHDGDVDEVFATVGEYRILRVRPQKFVYLSDKSPCRKKPFSEELIDHLHADESKHPGKLCRFTEMIGICPAIMKISDSGIIYNSNFFIFQNFKGI